MNAIKSWTPNGNLINVQDEMHRLFHDLVASGEVLPAAPTGWSPAVDVHEADRNYTLQLDLPGVNPKDVKLELVDGLLTIRGERKAEPAAEGIVTHRLERTRGAFERVFRLKVRVDQDAIKATYQDGVLRIDLPKAPESVKREIAIDLG